MCCQYLRSLMLKKSMLEVCSRIEDVDLPALTIPFTTSTVRMGVWACGSASEVFSCGSASEVLLASMAAELVRLHFLGQVSLNCSPGLKTMPAELKSLALNHLPD